MAVFDHHAPAGGSILACHRPHRRRHISGSFDGGCPVQGVTALHAVMPNDFFKARSSSISRLTKSTRGVTLQLKCCLWCVLLLKSMHLSAACDFFCDQVFGMCRTRAFPSVGLTMPHFHSPQSDSGDGSAELNKKKCPGMVRLGLAVGDKSLKPLQPQYFPPRCGDCTQFVEAGDRNALISLLAALPPQL